MNTTTAAAVAVGDTLHSVTPVPLSEVFRNQTFDALVIAVIPCDTFQGRPCDPFVKIVLEGKWGPTTLNLAPARTVTIL